MSQAIALQLPGNHFPDIKKMVTDAAARAARILAGIILLAVVYTQKGEEHTADVFDGTVSNSSINYYIGWGTGTNAAAKGDTTLQTESAESRVTATKSQPSADKNQCLGTITSAGTQTITEAGLFTASTSGNLVIRGVFSGIALATGDAIEFTITLEWT